MQSVTGSVSTPSTFSGWEFLVRVARAFTNEEPVADRPAIRWEEMTPVDFEGEDTSLRQDHLELMR